MELVEKFRRIFGVLAADATVASDVSGEPANVSNAHTDGTNVSDPHAHVSRDEECGFDLYPERRRESFKPSFWSNLFPTHGREQIDRVRCERKLYRIMKEAPLAKLMFGALQSAGCDIDYRRNFCCEICAPGVKGGYDRYTQQVIICQNNVRNEDIMAGVLIHELIHMYDHCANNIDFKKLEHLACSEIRAANLTSCSILGSFLMGDINPLEFITFSFGKKHERCVKRRALESVKAARNITEEEAMEVIEKVFPYCYNDLEPIGRRLRSGSDDATQAFLEGKYYGYV